MGVCFSIYPTEQIWNPADNFKEISQKRRDIESIKTSVIFMKMGDEIEIQ